MQYLSANSLRYFYECPILTYVSETFSGIFCIMSSSKVSSIASGIVSSFNFIRRNAMISFLVGVMDLVAALLARCLSTSPRTCGLPVRNSRVRGHLWRIWLSESRSFTRCPAGHSSRPSMQIYIHREDEISRKSSTIFYERRLLTTNNLLSISESFSYFFWNLV